MANLPSEPEFAQAYEDLASALENSSFFQKHPAYRKALTIAAVPERVIQFRVVWENDKNEVQVNQGYRVQFNSSLGPYKGGTRFHPTVNLSVLKFLALEQTFKNALTGLNLGGAKGGADFDPKGKSDGEIRRFCVAYMRQLSKYIGADTDIPAGDIGVTAREVGWLFGTYKAETSLWEGCITGKGRALGGSLMKPEATGYGLIYYVDHMVRYASQGKETFENKQVAISGSGNVAQYAALKAVEFGAIVVSLSDSRGTIIPTAAEGISSENLITIIDLKTFVKGSVDTDNLKKRKQLVELMRSHKDTFRYIDGERPWKNIEKVDVALPCATQNEVSEDEAEYLISAGCKIVAEGSNMGCSQGAIGVFEKHRKERKKGEAVWFAPGKAANIGGSAISGLEMAQNSQRTSWSAEHVDDQLKKIMKTCFQTGLDTATEYVESIGNGEKLPSLLAGSNIAGFAKVAAAMRDQGDWWSCIT